MIGMVRLFLTFDHEFIFDSKQVSGDILVWKDVQSFRAQWGYEKKLSLVSLKCLRVIKLSNLTDQLVMHD